MLETVLSINRHCMTKYNCTLNWKKIAKHNLDNYSSPFNPLSPNSGQHQISPHNISVL